MKKKIILLLITLCVMSLVFTGCTGNKTEVEPKEADKVEPITLNVASPGGPTTVTLVKMIKDNPSLGEEVTTVYEVLKTPDILTAKLIGGELDFAVVPTNLAVVMNNKEVDYRIAASSVWGLLYIASSEELATIEDLKGKEIYTIGRGITPDILLRYILTSNGLNPDEDVTINYLNSPQELAQYMISGKASVAVMPEPILTTALTKKDDIKIVFNMQEEWSKITGLDSYPMSSLIVKGSLVDERPEIVDAFLKEYKKSIEWVNSNPQDAGAMTEKLDIGLKAPIVAKAIPRSNLKYVGINEAKPAILEYINVLHEFSPKTIGGKLPSEELYMEK